ncbi:aminoglycoside phosphotransferase family protein [Acutalibacter sp. 1XD8-33]|uniref:phosphotransferase enzyme family protein n=1 Tax=Acutalibacter sp. 1XD8-33 TaxID=2320081 RepID=UPI000EA0944E|nr:aminoglycoside phosphotransferase family protein [Acutalibacter sp. 1XD8-33]RKJ41491.1 aminoglycoside phosphotransferase family protein [Acutalibacter sp. 1XD8-33]
MNSNLIPNPIPNEVLRAFGLSPSALLEALPGGHINDTYLVSGRYVLQRINHYVFPHPGEIMENMVGVTQFLQNKVRAQGGDPFREILQVVLTLDGAPVCQDATGNFWRCTLHIDGTASFETPDSAQMLWEAGRAFGNFQAMLSGYPADTLHEIIPDFHNTPVRVQQLKDAASRDPKGRLQEVAAEMEFALSREGQAGLLTGLLAEGKLPLRVTHNDTKMSNILFDETTRKAVCVIDLDTVMPGLTAYDFGDSIRAGASTAAEDETDLNKVCFDLDLYRAYTEGFLNAAGSTLTSTELDTLPDGAWTMTYEVGIRFLADYLNGDVYFRTAHPRQNLDRARNQFHLVRQMEERREEMGEIIRAAVAAQNAEVSC